MYVYNHQWLDVIMLFGFSLTEANLRRNLFVFCHTWQGLMKSKTFVCVRIRINDMSYYEDFSHSINMVTKDIL